MTTGIDIALDQLKNQLREIRMQLSDIRKHGHDTFIAEQRIHLIPAKIQLAEATKNTKDIQIANQFLQEAMQELEEAKSSNKNQDEFTLDHALAQFKADYNQKDMIEHALRLAQETHNLIEQGDRDAALGNYVTLRQLYKFMPEHEKRQIYAVTMEVYQKIIKGNSNKEA